MAEDLVARVSLTINAARAKVGTRWSIQRRSSTATRLSESSRIPREDGSWRSATWRLC